MARPGGVQRNECRVQSRSLRRVALYRERSLPLRIYGGPFALLYAALAAAFIQGCVAIR